MCSCTYSFIVEISIHSLRMEGDIWLGAGTIHKGLFQSTPSAWRETRQKYRGRILRNISIHSLRMEGDDLPCHRSLHPTHFNPLPPHGGRHMTLSSLQYRSSFQSTPSAWRETYSQFHAFFRAAKFQSTPSAWRETAKLHRKAFFISPILVQSCKKGCKRLHSAPEKMVFFEKREKNLVRNLQHLSVRL